MERIPTTFEDICSTLNEYHKDNHYILSFKVHGCIIVTKYDNKTPETADEMYLLIKEARREAKAVRAAMEK